MNITKVENFSVDIEELQSQSEYFLDDSVWNKHNQLCFLNTPDVSPNMHQGAGNVLSEGYPASGLNEKDFTVFNPMWTGTIFEDIYKNFPLPVTRMRMMKIPPKRCYSMHIDGQGEIRYHIAVYTNPYAFFVYGDKQQMFHVPSDGNAYIFSVEEKHSAVNFDSSQARMHLVLNAVR